MRFDTPIFFQQVSECQYDPATGDYADAVITETKRDASVTDTMTETLKLLYGELKQGSLVIRLQNHYNAPFSQIRIADKFYSVDFSRQLRNMQVFIVHEVQ